jgi:uncharacterized protein YfaS (alpha-2-macroglobulin family)
MDWRMLNNKPKKELDIETAEIVLKEIAQPRMSKSARRAELSLGSSRILEQPSIIMRGIVDKLILSPRQRQPEKAQIAVEGADRGYRDLRIENSLTDEYGDEVKLKKGAHVEITVTTKDANDI